MVHGLYIALCAHHPESDLLSPCIWSPLSFITLPHPWGGPPNNMVVPSGIHHVVICVYELLFVSLVCSFVAFNFKSHHMNEINHRALNIFHLTCFAFSRSIHVVANDSISSFLMAEWYSNMYMHHFVLINCATTKSRS